jgi:Lipase (class 3)
MTISSRDYAALSEHSYRHPQTPANDSVKIEGVDYRILANSDQRNGYQGTIYQRLDTREIVVAHRGTEPNRSAGETFRDLVRTDGGMVTHSINNQSQDTPPVTVTGHSLGGTLAQITAHRFDLHGETFNAYGAAALRQGVPEGGNNVINHVRATDVVSAGAPHYGQVRIYATQQDVDALNNAGYNNRETRWDLRNPLGVAASRGLAAHELGPFIREGGGGPLMTEANQQLAQDRHNQIDKYRDDVQAIRTGITLGSDATRDGINIMRGRWDRVFTNHSTRADLGDGALMSDNPMVSQTYAALARNSDPAVQNADARTVAGIVTNAQQQGLTNIDHVTAGNGNGTLYAVQGRSVEDPAARVAPVNLTAAQQQPLAATSQLSAAQQTAQPDPQLAEQPQRAAAMRS